MLVYLVLSIKSNIYNTLYLYYMKNLLVVLCLFGLSASACKAQSEVSTTNKKAVVYFDKSLEYIKKQEWNDAVLQLNAAIKEDENFVEAHMRLADVAAQKQVNKPKIAIAEYQKVIELNPNFSKKAYTSLASILMNNLRYAEARPVLDKYLQLSGLPENKTKEAIFNIKNCEFAANAIKNPVLFAPYNLGKNINTPENEYLPAITANEKYLIFTRRDDATDENFYISIKTDTTWQKAIYLSQTINTSENEGAQCLSADGQYVYFTACNRKDGFGSCDLYVSKLNGTEWDVPKNLGNLVNSARWESQPTISSDGNTLYFASDRPGGLGGIDIWKTTKNAKGDWQAPENLSKGINTAYDDYYPFIHADNQTLYFCSTGWPGMGGSDIYMATKTEQGFLANKNIGYPINTPQDETGLVVSTNGKHAYYATITAATGGKTDIFSFDVPLSAMPKPVTYVSGRFYDKELQTPIFAKYELFDNSTGKSVAKGTSNSATGEFLVVLPTGKNYNLNVYKEGYLFSSENFDLNKTTTNKPFELNVKMSKLIEGENVVLKNIFFDTNLFTLKKESETELVQILKLLTDNPLLKIEISGHTDNVGKDDYNLTLSKNRAKAVVDYLVSKGIVAERLTFQGYGKTKPISENTTEEGRANNRRTEFKVLAVK